MPKEFKDGSQHSAEAVEFMMAMDRYKRENRRPFPTWAEVLKVLISLGWRKTSGGVAGGPSEGGGAEQAEVTGACVPPPRPTPPEGGT